MYDPLHPPTDAELMLAVARGDLGSFDAIVERHQEWAWRVACRFTGDAAAAEDMAQEAFLRILEAAPRYGPSAGFRTYLLRVLSRLCMDFRRKKKPVSAADLPDRAGLTTPETEALLGERRALVRSALDDLPANQRLAVILKYYEGFGTAEIAGALDVSPKAVERLLHRAREALEVRLEGLRA